MTFSALFRRMLPIVLLGTVALSVLALREGAHQGAAPTATVTAQRPVGRKDRTARTAATTAARPTSRPTEATDSARSATPTQDEPSLPTRPARTETVMPFVVQPTVSTRGILPLHSADVKNPDNLQTGLFYDEETGTYKYGTRLGGQWLYVPFYLAGDEVRRMGIEQSMRDYFRRRNNEEFQNRGKDKFDFSDMQFSLGPAEKIFGPGGVRVRTQGSAELKIGATHRFTDNPSLAERNRSVFGFDFDEKVNLSLNGKVGDKVNMDFNYNTDATFNFDTQQLKLRYEGKEDEIVKLIEAGNVSLAANSSLIRGAQSLFGVRADMQFGRLKLRTMVAQKKSAAQNVNSRGGVQLNDFEFSAADYDENRHFFLAHYFRDHYDGWMTQLPNVLSGVKINRIEVWITNTSAVTDNTRNLVALTDLGEAKHIKNSHWTAANPTAVPANTANNEYATLTGSLPAVRDITQTGTQLDGIGMTGGDDYEKIESARLLSPSEYRLNADLGYLSLRTALQPDQVLAVAFEYTYKGENYQVGEFSTDLKDNTRSLIVKSLKNTACTPRQGNWALMMRNVYSLGATDVQRERFMLDVKYLSDTTGVYLSYLPIPSMKDQRLLTVMGLDRLDNNARRVPNGYFDFVEGYTVDAASGRVFFPVVEPFGRNLIKAIGDTALARQFAYTELYDSTHTVAKQIAEHNKFRISGKFKATKADEIQLNTTGIPQGSVVVRAGGQLLTEGTDYTVDYNAGTVKILNKSILDAGTPVSCSVESNADYGMQRKTMFGVDFQYDVSKKFQVGGTLMHLGEQPLTSKVAMGSEPLNNTIWGLNMAWKTQSQWLTDLVNRLPFVHTTTPSNINFTAEFAQLIAGRNTGAQGNASYIDDFENAKTDIDISTPQQWTISSTPSMFAESQLTNNVRYGYNRALLAWYVIDPLFTRRSSSLTPGYIKNDVQQLSDPRVREIYASDLYPNKSLNYKDAATLPVLNLAYYPNERGPYNLDPSLDSDGKLRNPAQRWGGMMRRIETSDFDAANVEYVEFWMMDPFTEINGKVPNYTGDLYFNLGEISEDVLKDGRKFYESGLPTDGDRSQVAETAWGLVPTQNAVTYAFNTSSDARRRQDVGYNGLTSEEERTFGAYADYLRAIRPNVRPAVYDSIAQHPSGDQYYYFRGKNWDEQRASILERYKYINNPNGNSAAADGETYASAYKTTPDVEDINQDFTLNEYEKYYQYRVRIDPTAMQVGQNYIVDMRTVNSKTRDGKSPATKWYLFRIPLSEYERKYGSISDFSSIRFIRMFLTGFDQPIVLRFATLSLVRGEWRDYRQPLYQNVPAASSGQLVVSAVNFEENNDKHPVNYVLPPGISRAIEPGQDQVLQNNEQALSLTVKDLGSGDARAVYKNTHLDLRRYKHLQLFVHANALPGDKDLADGQVSLFLRLGSDYKNNFYEYEIPLMLTPEGRYTGTPGRRSVWPTDNMIDIDLEQLTHVKKARNRKRAQGLAAYTTLYDEYDPQRPKNKISVQGNPSLGDVRTVMIGLRNNSRSVRSIEVWANELRLQDFANKGGWAAQSQLNIQLADLANINLAGHAETNGFGGLEETVSQRRDDDLYQYSVTTNLDAGKLLPPEVKLTAPIYYSYSKEVIVPRYNPLDTDMPMSDALDALPLRSQRDSLRNITNHVVTNKNFSVSGLRFNRTTQSAPMPYDLGNFTASFAHATRHTSGTTTAREIDMNWKFDLAYNYSPGMRTVEPLKQLITSRSPWLRILRDFGVNPLPQNISLMSNLSRHYYELQERDIEQLDNRSLPLSFASDFLWNRSLQFRWDPTKNIHFSFMSGTDAEIQQPNVVVNKELYPTEYAAWKDSVMHSLRDLGRPLNYRQTADLSWNVPLNKLPALDWVTADFKYNAAYNWTRGVEAADGSSLGNVIGNRRDVTFNSRLSLEALYNKVPFLKRVNRKFSAGPTAGKKPEEKKPFERAVTLRKDTATVVVHNLSTKKLRVVAIRPDGNRFPVRYKVLDVNRIEVLNRDTLTVKVTVTPQRRTEELPWFQLAEYGSRALMMVRNVNVAYRTSSSLNLPGFMPSIGDAFGQARPGGLLAPGLDFAFATIGGESYVHRAAERGWLLQSDSIITPAVTSSTEDLQIRATLEPFRDFKINLSFSRNLNRSKSIQYMYAGMPTLQNGSFAMTTWSLGTAFSSFGNPNNGYASASFRRFNQLLDQYRAQVEQRYAGATYPNGMGQWSGKPYDPANGGVDRYSASVMIPAFLDAYTSSGGRLDLFPAVSRLLPSWTLQYAGLAQLPSFKRWFKSFNLNHAYKSLYSVGAYGTFQSFREMADGFGFVTAVENGLPTPSSRYDISTVTLNETFSPLLGIDMTFHNDLTARIEMRRTRVLTLSMTSQLLNETHSNDVVVGFGYRVADFKGFTRASHVKRTVRSRNRKNAPEENTPTPTVTDGTPHSLNLRLDISFRSQSALQRNLLTRLSQATNGNRALQISLAADYEVSKFLTVSAYYDRQSNQPLLTSSAYPSTMQDFGINLKFQLTR